MVDGHDIDDRKTLDHQLHFLGKLRSAAASGSTGRKQLVDWGQWVDIRQGGSLQSLDTALGGRRGPVHTWLVRRGTLPLGTLCLLNDPPE